MLGLTCLRVFKEFDPMNPMHDDIMKIFRAYGSKKIAKEAPRHLT